MIQRIATRLFIEHHGKPLLVRRSDGRSTILGKYELPGGRIYSNEQPEGALKRYARDDLGIKIDLDVELVDVFMYTDQDDRNIQYAILLYRTMLPETKRVIALSQHYDRYLWYQPGKPEPGQLTGLTQFLLGAEQPALSGTKKLEHVSPALPVVYSDGGSRGNPGPSAAGYVLVNEAGSVVDEGGEYLGITTNNQAEYQGVRIGLEAALARGWRTIDFRIDSMLVVNQLNGLYKIRNRELWPIHERVRELADQFDRVRFSHVPRELNQLADGMVNKTLDAQRLDAYTKKQQLAR